MGMLNNTTPTAFRFQGSYTESDLDALAQFTVSQLLDQRIGKATASAMVLLAIGALLLGSWPVAIGGFLAVIGLSALVRYVILPKRLIRHARQLSGLSGDRTIEVDDRGVHHRSAGHVQSHGLRAIRRLVLHKSHLFILLKPGCLMLPLGWIRPPATIDNLVAFLTRRGDDPSS